jgi:hypothetical protein
MSKEMIAELKAKYPTIELIAEDTKNGMKFLGYVICGTNNCNEEWMLSKAKEMVKCRFYNADGKDDKYTLNYLSKSLNRTMKIAHEREAYIKGYTDRVKVRAYYRSI